MKEKVTCAVCGTNFEIEGTFEPCPYCDFEYEGIDYVALGLEDEKDSPNAPSFNEARNNLKKGLTAYGKPLPPKPQK